MLTGKYKPGQPLPSGSRATDEKGGADTVKSFLTDDILERVQQLAPIAKAQGLTLAQLAVAWVLANENVAGAIIGASRPEQVESNVQASGVTLPAEVLSQIDDVIAPVAERDPRKTVSPPERVV